MLKRERLIFQNGERYTCLINEQGVPDFWATLFLTTHYRSSSAETMRSIVNILAHFHVWDMAQKKPFCQRIVQEAREAEAQPADKFKQPVFLSIGEVQSLARHCRLKTSSARKRLNPKKKKVVSMAMGAAATKDPEPVVSLKYQRDRLTVISLFLSFIVENALREYEHYAYYLDAATKMCDLIIKQRSKKRGSKNGDVDPDKKAPSPEVFDQMISIAHPDNKNNPFTKLVRYRNYLAVRILYETGMRSGELLQLKVEDVNLASQSISIVRRHDDPEDIWRALEPNAKTNERDIPIPPDLVDLIRKYIVSERREMVQYLPKNKRHGFLLVSNKITVGHPVSLRQLSNLVLKLSKDKFLASLLESKGFVVKKQASPHSYRHNRNNQISIIIDLINEKAVEEGRPEKIITPKKEKQIRMYLMGHSSEKSAEVYNLRHTKNSAERLNVKQMQLESDKLKDEIPSWMDQFEKREVQELMDRVLAFCDEDFTNREG